MHVDGHNPLGESAASLHSQGRYYSRSCVLDTIQSWEKVRHHTGDARRRLHASFVENCTAEYGKMRTTLVPLPLQNALTPSSLQQCLSAQATQIALTLSAPG